MINHEFNILDVKPFNNLVNCQLIFSGGGCRTIFPNLMVAVSMHWVGGYKITWIKGVYEHFLHTKRKNLKVF